MANCKKYTAAESTTAHHHTRPVGECQSCAYFSQKNCGAHQIKHVSLICG